MTNTHHHATMPPPKVSLERPVHSNLALPLYEEVQQSEEHSIAFPSSRASPMEVAGFLICLLTDYRGLSTDAARRVAAKWTRGTCLELRKYPPAIYFEIFGKEDGWIVYREVHLAMEGVLRRSFWYRWKAYIVLALAVCFELTALVVTIASRNGTTTAGGLAVAAAFASLFGLIGCMYALVWAFPYLEGAEKNIEGRLTKALSRSGPGED